MGRFTSDSPCAGGSSPADLSDRPCEQPYQDCKKANDILDDAKVVSEITADKAQKLDGIIDGVSESVSDVAETLKGNKNIISAATNVVNAVSNLAGMAKAADRKKR